MIICLLILNCKGGEYYMPVESVNTPLQALTYIASNLVILLSVVSVLTYLFLKGYDFVMKNNSSK